MSFWQRLPACIAAAATVVAAAIIVGARTLRLLCYLSAAARMHPLLSAACQVAEECGLKRLRIKCIREICVTLSRGKKGVGPRTVSTRTGWQGWACVAGLLPCQAQSAKKTAASLRTACLMPKLH
jgi:hypothetical protein